MEDTHKDHEFQLLALHRTIPKDHTLPESILQMLLDLCEVSAVTTSPGSLLQCPTTLQVKILFLISNINLLWHIFRSISSYPDTGHHREGIHVCPSSSPPESQGVEEQVTFHCIHGYSLLYLSASPPFSPHCLFYFFLSLSLEKQRNLQHVPASNKGLLTRAWTRTDGFKLKETRLRLCKKFLAVRVVRNWNRFPRKVVEALFPDVFKVRLYGALSNLAQWKIPLSMLEGIELDDF